MPFSIPSLADTRDFIVALGKALFPRSNYGSRRSYHGRRATYLAGAVTQLHAHVDSAQRDVHPLTAGDGKPIQDWGDTVGVKQKSATPARKAAALRVRGAAAEVAPIGSQLLHDPSGLMFELTSTATIPGIVGDPDSFVDVDVAALGDEANVGSKTRLNAGEILNFTPGIPGIQTQAVLQLDLDEDGFDAEQFGSYRNRVLATFSQPPSGGNQDDFVAWALAALNTIATAYAYPVRAGLGTVDLVVFYAGSGSARSVSQDDRDAVLDYIRTQTTAPFQVTGPGGPLRALETIADPQDVEILLTPDGRDAFRFDWDDTVAGEVDSWNATTRELTWTTTLPSTLRAGHRIVLAGVASAQDGREFKIESISGTDSVILEKAPAVAPVATDLIYSGGPLVTPVRDAIVAHLNGEIVYAGRGLTPIPQSKTEENGVSVVGLDVLAEPMGPANPGGIYGPWPGGIVRSTLFGIAKYKSGVRDVTIVSPASNYEAEDDAFPNDAQIHFVCPGAVLIRQAH